LVTQGGIIELTLKPMWVSKVGIIEPEQETFEISYKLNKDGRKTHLRNGKDIV